MSSPALAQSLPDGSEELQSLKNVFLISQHHLRKTAAALLNQRGFKSSGWLFLDGTFGLVFGVPTLVKASRKGKTQGKNKKSHSSTSLGAFPACSSLQEHDCWDGFGIFWMDPARIWDFGLQNLLSPRLGTLPCATRNPSSSNKHPPGSQAAPSAKTNIIIKSKKGKKAPRSHRAWSALHRCHHQPDPNMKTMEKNQFSHWEGAGLGFQPPLNQARI